TRFRFSLANLLLAMVPLAISLAALRVVVERRPDGMAWAAFFVFVFAAPSSAGALVDGMRGIGKAICVLLLLFVACFVAMGVLLMFALLIGMLVELFNE